jgi:hypothetical protein
VLPLRLRAVRVEFDLSASANLITASLPISLPGIVRMKRSNKFVTVEI